MGAPVLSRCETSLQHLPERLLIGVSGGIDSVALLHALVRIGRQPIVLHFDHGWREESAAEAQAVKKLARSLGLKCLVGKGRPTAAQKREALARSSRYAFFTRQAERLGVKDLVLAHHADDQVETFLLQLLRGSGSAGRGMDVVSHRQGLILHRPWLGITRKEIAVYARREKLLWREDASNLDLRHRRNLLRHRVIPYLKKKVSPAVAENLWRAAEIAGAESEWLDSLCAVAAGKAELTVTTLRIASRGEQRRTILRWLQNRGVPDVGFADVENVRGLLEHLTPARINLSGGRFARRRAGKIFTE